MHHQSLFVVIAVVLAAGLVSCVAELGGLSFTVDFKDAKGLIAGDPVVYRGVKIGAVRSVDITSEGSVRVGVLIQRKHQELVCREARFVIEKAKDHGDRENARQITIKDRRGERTPVEEGDVLEGSEGGWPEILKSLEEAGKDALEAAERLADRLADCVKESCDSPEAERFRDDVSDFMRDADKVARDEWDRFRRDRLPALRERAERLRDKLKKEGKLEKAEKFWDDFTRWLDEIDAE